MKPSAWALEMLARATKAAKEEVRKHHAAGRSVSGVRDGKVVWIPPKKYTCRCGPNANRPWNPAGTHHWSQHDMGACVCPCHHQENSP